MNSINMGNYPPKQGYSIEKNLSPSKDPQINESQNQIIKDELKYPNDKYLQKYPDNPSQNNFPVQNNYPVLNNITQEQMTINQRLAQAFQGVFFSPQDPTFETRNVPAKQSPSMHVNTILASLILIGGVIVMILMLVRIINSIITGIIVVVVCYMMYLILAIGFSNIRNYINNLKKFEEYKQPYDNMVIAKGYFHFFIQCYHYQNKTVYRRRRIRTERTKVVTHTACLNYNPIQTKDESGALDGINDITRYVFIKYLKKFYFTNQDSQVKFQNAYNSFVNSNKSDQYQDHRHTFEIENFEQHVGFTEGCQGCHNSLLFILFNFLGLALPYACILQRSISRYEINIVKRVTCV